MTNHTPGPWSQGTTLPTRETLRWSPEEIALIDARERRMVFSGFTHADEGRGRQRVAVCRTAEDARLIAAAPEMLDLLRENVDYLCSFSGGIDDLDPTEIAWLSRALVVINKVEGPPRETHP